MVKSNRKGERMLPERTKKKIRKANEARNFREFLREVTDIFYNFPQFEEGIPTKYNPKTGEPEEFEVINPEPFDPLIEFQLKLDKQGKNYSDCEWLYPNSPFKAVVGRFKYDLAKLYNECPIEMKLEDKLYVLTQETSDTYGDPIGIRVSKIRKQISL